MSGEGRVVCHLPRGPCLQPPALTTAGMVHPATAAVLGVNGSSQARACGAHELKCVGAGGESGLGEPLFCLSLATHSGMYPGACVWYLPGCCAQEFGGLGA